MRRQVVNRRLHQPAERKGLTPDDGKLSRHGSKRDRPDRHRRVSFE